MEPSTVVVLDDVTPPYVRTTAALNACDANLAIALQNLLDSKTPDHGTQDHAWSLPAPSVVSA